MYCNETYVACFLNQTNSKRYAYLHFNVKLRALAMVYNINLEMNVFMEASVP